LLQLTFGSGTIKISRRLLNSVSKPIRSDKQTMWRGQQCSDGDSNPLVRRLVGSTSAAWTEGLTTLDAGPTLRTPPIGAQRTVTEWMMRSGWYDCFGMLIVGTVVCGWCLPVWDARR
jgi:hypothetical protein